MPRDVKLPNRLDTLLSSLFIDHVDPFALYWEIAAQVRPEQLLSVQKRIRKALQQKGEISTESAILVACVLSLTGFPAHRILQFLALYVRRGISLSQFEFTVSAIFVGSPPLPPELLYDITQYTYLEKRLLARKGMEISDRLKGSLTPELLLYLYLLALRDDLSNENVQLIGLIMKNCFPSEDVRTRLGGAGLEEYGEIVRAWKNAEQRSFAVSLGSGPEGREMRSFDRDSASFFLDKYFSDTALEKPSGPVPHAKAGPANDPVPAERPVLRSPPRRRRAEPRLTVQQSDGPAAPSPRTRRAPVRSTPAHAPPAQAPIADPAATVPIATSVQLTRGAGRFLLPFAPVLVAALVLGAALIAVPSTPWHAARAQVPVEEALPAHQPAGDRAAVSAAVPAVNAPPPSEPVSAAASSAPVGTASAPAPDVRPASTPYVVREGDSLWKIFRSLGRDQRGGKSWVDFLSVTRNLNNLADPDTIHPGKVLKLVAPGHSSP